MTNFESHQNAQPGPFEQFLQQSSIYREFLEASGPDDCDIADAQTEDHLPVEAHNGKLCIDLEMERARFAMNLDIANQAHPSVAIAFPSQITRLELDDLHRCVRRVIDSVYPRRGLTPRVALIEDEDEVRFDLANYWDGATYENTLAHSSLSAVIYYVQIQRGLPRISLLESGPEQPDLMYGFVPASGDSREFIKLSYLQARHISVDLVGVLLSRHKNYRAGNPPADAERLAQQIRSVCKPHAPRSLL